MVDETEENIFTPEELSLVMQMRIYDVLMALLVDSNKAVARDLLALHMEGVVVGSEPAINGVFLTNVLNAEEVPPESGASVD